MYAWTMLATVVIAVEYWAFSLPVVLARRRTGIRPPAMSGHPDLDRAMRVHLNTLEKLGLVLPTMWVAAMTVGDVPAGVAGLAWAATRVVFAVGYLRSASGRTAGALLGDVPEFSLAGMALFGAVRQVMGG